MVILVQEKTWVCFSSERVKTTSKRVIQKTAEATVDFIGNKVADF